MEVHNLDESHGFWSVCLSSGNSHSPLHLVERKTIRELDPLIKWGANIMTYSTLFTLWTSGSLSLSLMVLIWQHFPSVFWASVFIEHPPQLMKKVQEVNLTMDGHSIWLTWLLWRSLQNKSMIIVFYLSSVGYKFLPVKVSD